jgi:hypothetical protein
MNNLLDDRARTGILSRLERLEDGQRAQWGRMNVNQMVCHLGDQFRIALGQIRPADCSGFLSRTVLKWMVLAGATFSASPAFGKLSNRQWGRLAYVHMDHHLRQFGV